MFRRLLSLSRDSVVYGLSVAVSQFVGFLLIPLYTHYLTPADYGVLEILNTTGSMLGVIIALGLTSALLRSYYRYEDEEEKRAVVSTVLVFVTATSVLFVLILEMLSGHLSSLLFQSLQYTTYFRIIFLSLFCNTGIAIVITVFRAKGQPTRYAAASISQFILGVVLNIVFVVGFHKGLEGILYAGLITAALIYAVLIVNLVRQVRIRLSGHELKAMLAFGLPLVPAGLGAWILVMADRYFLQILSTSQEVGLYSLGYKLGMVIQTLLVGPFQLAWLPFLFSTAKESGARETYSRVFTYFVLIALFLALAISILAKEILMVMATPAFRDAYKVVPLIALSYVLYGCYYVLAVGINIEAKTKHMAMLVGVAAVLNLVLNYLLIPELGMMGAAVATLIGYTVLPIGSYLISKRYYRVDYEWNRLIKMSLVVVLIYVAVILVDRSYSAVHSHIIVGVFKVLLLFTYPILLYAFRFFQPEEIRSIKEVVRSAPAYLAQKLRRKPSDLNGPANVSK